MEDGCQVLGTRVHIVEDLAEAHGIDPHEATDAACWSFYKNKIVAGEEGGAVAFQDPKAAGRARQLRCLGFTPEHDFHHVPRGHNYRLANSLADLIIDSLGSLQDNVIHRRWAELACDQQCPEAWRMPKRDAPWVYDLRIRDVDAERISRIVRELNAEGIAARHGFKRMTCQDEYRVKGMGLTNAARASREVLYLPLCPGSERAFDLIKSIV